MRVRVGQLLNDHVEPEIINGFVSWKAENGDGIFFEGGEVDINDVAGIRGYCRTEGGKTHGETVPGALNYV
jgi:hypothetical protein